MSISSAVIDVNHSVCDLSFLSGADAAGNTLPLSSLTATIDDTTNAYIALNPASPSSSIYVVKRSTMAPGQNLVVHVTFNGKSQDGTAVSPTVIPVSLQTPVPPQATQILVGSTSQGAGTFTDPASPTVTLI
ncbi:MAG TPA: hypothetical protein VGR71_15115 [Nitrospira sp.]|nr:hypothetical protein [Nitrospira sp.]